MTLSIRFSVVDLQAPKMNPSPRARVMNEYSDPAFNDNWSGLCAHVTNCSAIFCLLTRALHGILGFSGPVHDPVRNLAPCEIVPALGIIHDNFASVTQASVSYEWSY
jgi:hypothetical protein